MGMYDEITVHVLGDTVFQTKDFDCLLKRYHITPEGQLILKKDNDLQLPKNIKAFNPSKFFGTVDFYSYDVNSRQMKEYVAVFADGWCRYIETCKDNNWKVCYRF